MRTKRVVALLTCIGTFTILWILLTRALPQPHESFWISGIYKAKEAAAAKVVGRKAVIIGGSGAHYSYSAKAITEATGIPTVNLGTHAGLGGEYILHRARGSLKPGDIAIVALEHQLTFRTKP